MTELPMSRKKAIRIDDFPSLPNALTETALKQKKLDLGVLFGNSHPIVLELGCGRGDYSIALAKAYPEKNFIGIDIRADRLWKGATRAIEEKISSVAWFYVRAEALLQYFAPHSISEIWITFPDPYPKKKQAKHRLTAPLFLKLYKKLLVPGGVIHLKTDSEPMFDFSLDVALDAHATVEQEVRNIYACIPHDPVLDIQTTFEKKHLAIGRKIFYVRFHF